MNNLGNASRLDAGVHSHASFSKIDVDGVLPSFITDSGDDASTHSHEDSSSPHTSKNGQSSYEDYSRALAPRGVVALLRQPISAKEPTFPVKLQMIISNPDFGDIIAWLPHGRSWRILQQKAFEERVIPLYFRHGRYSSFARQVNGWGFRRVTHGSDYNSYYHEVRVMLS